MRPFAAGIDRAGASRPLRWIVGVSALAIVGAAGVLGATYWKQIAWRSVITWAQPSAPSSTAPAAREMPPLPRRSETALARATVLAAGGHLRDALATLDAVRPTDAQKPAADRLRADIQHLLLALAPLPAPRSGAPERGSGRLP